MVEPEVLSAIGGHFAVEQPLDDLDGFRQPLVALDHARPAMADDVFVQALARAQS
jgi:hypothetical protein